MGKKFFAVYNHTQNKSKGDDTYSSGDISSKLIEIEGKSVLVIQRREIVNQEGDNSDKYSIFIPGEVSEKNYMVQSDGKSIATPGSKTGVKTSPGDMISKVCNPFHFLKIRKEELEKILEEHEFKGRKRIVVWEQSVYPGLGYRGGSYGPCYFLGGIQEKFL